MKRYLFISVLIFSIIRSVSGQVPDWKWGITFSGNEDEYPTTTTVDVEGNVYCSGSYSGIVDFDPGPGIYNIPYVPYQSTFITKLDSSGNLIWARGIGGESRSMILDFLGNVYTTGWLSGTADFDPGLGIFNLSSSSGSALFISKLDSSGNFIWAKAVDVVTNIDGFSIASNPVGDLYITGYYAGFGDFDPGIGVFNLSSTFGGKDVFILKLDNSGNFKWAKSIGSVFEQHGITLAIDQSENIVVSGYFEGTVDFDPDSIGIFNLIASGIRDAFISKFDTSGNLIWAKSLGGYYIIPNSLVIDDENNIYNTGCFDGTIDFDPDSQTIFNVTSNSSYDIFISKFDSAGTLIWVKSIGGNYDDSGMALALDDSQNIYTTGYFKRDVDFNPDSLYDFQLSSAGADDFFILKLDKLGNFLWAVENGGIQNDGCMSISIDNANKIYVSGGFMSSGLRFGQDSLLNSDGGTLPAVFIARLENKITGIERFSIDDTFQIYPNPCTGQFTIKIKNIHITKVEIYSLLGEQQYLYTKLNSNIYKSQTAIEVDASDWVPGIYFIKLQTDKGNLVKKLVVE